MGEALPVLAIDGGGFCVAYGLIRLFIRFDVTTPYLWKPWLMLLAIGASILIIITELKRITFSR